MKMSIEEITGIKNKYKDKVYISCDEYHGHSSKCLGGDMDAIIICQLCDTILSMKNEIKQLSDELTK